MYVLRGTVLKIVRNKRNRIITLSPSLLNPCSITKFFWFPWIFFSMEKPMDPWICFMTKVDENRSWSLNYFYSKRRFFAAEVHMPPFPHLYFQEIAFHIISKFLTMCRGVILEGDQSFPGDVEKLFWTKSWCLVLFL